MSYLLVNLLCLLPDKDKERHISDTLRQGGNSPIFVMNSREYIVVFNIRGEKRKRKENFAILCLFHCLGHSMLKDCVAIIPSATLLFYVTIWAQTGCHYCRTITGLPCSRIEILSIKALCLEWHWLEDRAQSALRFSLSTSLFSQVFHTTAVSIFEVATKRIEFVCICAKVFQPYLQLWVTLPVSWMRKKNEVNKAVVQAQQL